MRLSKGKGCGFIDTNIIGDWVKGKERGDWVKGKGYGFVDTNIIGDQMEIE